MATNETVDIDLNVKSNLPGTLADLKQMKLDLKSIKDMDTFRQKKQEIDDLEDSLKSAKTGAGNFAEVLGTIPGPLGQIGSQVGGTLQSLKQFGALKFADLKSSFVELGKDVVDAGKGIANLTGLTKLYEATTVATSRVLKVFGLEVEASSVAVKGFSKALLATGIGALVVAIGYLIANFDELTESLFGATAETKAYDAVNQQAIKTSGELIVNETALIGKIQKGGLTRQEQIHVLNEWNAKHKDTNLLFNDYKKLQDYVINSGPQYIEYIKAKAKADANYSLILLKQKELLETQVKSPAEFRKWYDYFSDQAIFGKIGDVDKYRKDIAASKINIEIDALANQTDKLTKEAEAAAKKAGVVSTEKFVPTTTTPAGPKGETNAQKIERLKKEAAAVQAELDRAADVAYAKSLKDRDRELYDAGGRYNELLIKAKKYGLDTTALAEAYRQEEANINKKYDESDAKTKQERLEREKEFWAKAKKDADDKRAKAQEEKYKQDALIKGDADAKYARIAAGAANDLDLQRQILEAKKVLDDEYYAKQLANEKLTAEQIRELNDRKLADQIFYTEKTNALETQRIAVKQQALNDIISIVGAESDIGRAALVAKQLLSVQELFLEVKRTITFSAQAAARSVVAVAEGTAQTAKIGFPQNIPMLIGYAAQAFGIISAIKSAVSSAKSSASGNGSGMTSISAPPPIYGGTPAVSTPQIQGTEAATPGSQIAQTISASSGKIIKAYVVSGDVSSQQALDRKTNKGATFGQG